MVLIAKKLLRVGTNRKLSCEEAKTGGKRACAMMCFMAQCNGIAENPQFRVGHSDLLFAIMKKKFVNYSKKTSIVLFGFVLLSTSTCYGQLEYLYALYVYGFDSMSGYCYIQENTLESGEAFEEYKLLTGDTWNDLVLVRTWEDPILHLNHYYYQQTYEGLRVEAGVIKEHADENDEYLIYTHGMLVPDLAGDPTPTVPEIEAMGQILSLYSGNTFAWMDDDWEAQIQEDLGDAMATNYPEGELLWALDNYKELPWIIPAARYTLAWKFDVFSIDPYFHKAIFVDANTGSIFREDNLDTENGTGLTYYHGTQTIDTDWAGAINKYILWANDNGRNIHTKQDYNIGVWGLGTNYNNSTTTWGSGDLEGTSTHWFASESWDFFTSAPYNLDLYNMFDGKEVRVWADINALLTGSFSYVDNDYQYIIMDRDEEQAIDIVAHEFTHRIQQSGDQNLWLNNTEESGALKESFADIFGKLVENRTESGIDWIHGADPGNVDTRNFGLPGSDYYHFELGDEPDCIGGTHSGQPDTYLGENWYSEDDCDRGGIHGNSGVQNYWFYLLAEGGSGNNDNLDSFSIQGIGLDNASRITFYNMMVNMTNGDGYWQAREGAIEASRLFYGMCSNEEIQTTNAWHAVGVGLQSFCPPVLGTPDTEDPKVSTITVSPNPANGIFNLNFSSSGNKHLVISTVWGSIIAEFDLKGTMRHQVNLEEYPNGVYFVEVQEKHGSSFLKLIKQ